MQRGLAAARLAASWSKDPRTKVGAAIFDTQNVQIATGYNGLPRGIPDHDDYLTTHKKNLMVIHAELNAILNARSPVAGSTLFVTLFPCGQCAAAIIQSGIRKVVMPIDCAYITPDSKWSDHWRAARDMFDMAGTTIHYVGVPTNDL